MRAGQRDARALRELMARRAAAELDEALDAFDMRGGVQRAASVAEARRALQGDLDWDLVG